MASLIKGMGYHTAYVALPGRDGGMDIIAYGDPLGTRPPRIKVQVKPHASAIPVEGLHSFLAVQGDDDVGIFVIRTRSLLQSDPPEAVLAILGQDWRVAVGHRSELEAPGTRPR